MMIGKLLKFKIFSSRENINFKSLHEGLPGAGKTYWAEKHRADQPEKNYNILGTNNLIDKMKVEGLSRKRNYTGRWEELIKQVRGMIVVLETKVVRMFPKISQSRRRPLLGPSPG